MPRKSVKATRTKARATKGNPATLEAKKVTVTCALCGGHGKDPWGVMSNLSDCQVCLGRGKVNLQGPVDACNFCGGKGIQPYTTSRLHCLACGGKGVVTRITGAATCSNCDGTGVYPRRPQPVPCPRCKGQGKLAKAR